MVKASNLRGRGGAGFPTGMKWSFLPKQSEKPVYLAVNADESEPGTFKDRELIEDDPHQLLEGIIISSYAIRCHTAYVYIRGEFALGARVLEEAIAEARARGLLGKNILGTGFDLEVWVHRGAGASMPVFTPEEIDVPMDMDSVQKAGSFLGSAGIMVMDDSVCMVWALMVLERFFHHESCGQCTPCREGTGWLHRVLVRLEEGAAVPRDVDLLRHIAGNMLVTTICALPDPPAMPTRAFVTTYRAEFDQHAALGRCPLRSDEPGQSVSFARAHAHG